MKNLRKIFKSIISISIALVFIFSVGCAKKDPPPTGNNTATIVPGTPVEKEITINKNELSLKVGQTETLLVLTQDQTSNSPIVWSSENEAIAKIDAQGTVEAINEGETNIVVTQGTLTAKCKVISSFMGETAQVELSYGDEVAIQPNKGLKLSPTILFDGKTFTDGQFEFSIEGSDSGFTVENGEIKGTTTGNSTIVAIKGTWRGQTAVSKYLTVNVVDNVNLVVNEYSNGDIIEVGYIPTAEQVAVSFTPVVYVNDVLQTGAVISVSVDTNNMTYDAANNQLIVENFGSARVTVKYNYQGNNDIVKVYIFEVVPSEGYGQIELDVGNDFIIVLTEGQTWVKKYIAEGEAIELPVLNCFGYEFKGWKNTSTEDIITVSGGKCVITSYDGEDCTYVAVWERIDNIVSGPITTRK